MVSINFASLNPGLQAYLRPAGFPHAHPRISNILGHGYKLTAISLLALAFGDLACAVAKALALATAIARGHDHGWGNGLIPYVMVMVW